MAGYQPARGAARRETMQEFMTRRTRDAASFGRGLVKTAIRVGQDYRPMTPDEVMAYGDSLVRGLKPKATQGGRRNAPPSARRSSLDDSSAAKAVGGAVAHAAGLAPGVARGALHTAKGAVDGALFVARLTNPLDEMLSEPGQSAWAQVDRFGRSVGDYAVQVARDPSVAGRDIRSAGRAFRVEHDPTATPVADTFAGELKRNFNLGMNNGELVFDAGSLLVGGGAIRGAAGLGRAAKAATAAERAYFEANPRAAASFARPYPKSGMSHHIVKRTAPLPSWLGGGRYPEWFIESEFNKIQHEGISTRDLYRNHVGLDKHYNGGRIRGEFGGGTWSGPRNLGWDKYGSLDRLNYGTSPATKAVVGPVLVGGTASDALRREETR